ncbi:hypothetical protein TWF730_010181 [Orbilia blumenaviensis]|uniref:F-box domain-containing protein n=1 Tax=Orbilia blumenaviensis TaxID=1796055 RepID=A0AAV9UP26_9PEZI
MSDIPQLSLQLQSTSLASSSSSSDSASSANKDRNNNRNLSTLPIDILTHHLIPQFANPPVHLSRSPAIQVSPDSSALRQLASTSKHFRSLVKGQYKTYVQHQYPTVYAHAITTTVSPNLNSINWSSLAAHSEQLCRRWALRQFYISRVPLGVPQSSSPSTARHHDYSTHHHSQRFNSNNNNNNRDVKHSFSPCIAVSESPDGTETLVIGQGASLAVRRGEYSLWREIKRKGMTLGGADDILSVHIYNPDTILAVRSSSVEIVSNVLGKDGINDAGEDGPLRITQAADLFPSGAKNPTGGISSSCLASIASSSCSSSTRSFAITTSASTTAHSVQLFTLDSGLTTPTFPKASTLTSPLPSKPYTSTFLTNSTIATGHRTGITLHHLSNASLTAVEIPHPITSYNHALSVHSLTPLSLSPSSSSNSSILASGWSDGVTRLLDIRSNKFIAEFENPVSNEAVPIYSLLQTAPLGNLLLAGSSLHHAVEVHDLRYAGNMHSSVISDYYFNNSSSSNNFNGNGNGNATELTGEGCLLFFDSLARGNILPPTRGNNNNNNSNRRRGGKGSTAIYSLSSSSPASGKVYIGVENGVLNMDFRKRKVGKYWGAGLSSVEKVRKKEAERNTGGGVPMYWFDSVRGAGDEEGGVNGRWWCGGGKVAVKVRERR